jgi:hypothetical protein
LPLAAGLPPGHPPGWEVIEADGLIIHYRPQNGTLASGLARSGPGIRARFAQVLETGASRPVDVVLIPSGPRGEGEGSGIPVAPDWAAGFTVPGSDVLFIRVRTLGVYPDRGLASVFAHELGHAELGRLAGPGRLPRWFEEGACMVLARPWDLRDSLSLSLAMLFRDPATLIDLEHHFPERSAAARSAYAQAFSFVSWLAERHGGAAGLGRVARRVGEGNDFSTAFTLEYRLTPRQALEAWRRSVGRWHRIITVLTGTTVFWIVAGLLFITVALRKRRRSRAILERWEAEEGARGVPDKPIEPR